MAKKTYTNAKGQRRHLTRWQQEVSKHGIRGAKKHYAGYKQRPAPPTTTGNVRATKGGTRRFNDNRIGRGRRSKLYYKGDKVGTWTKSGGNKTKGRTGLSWYMERGYGTAKKPVPDTKLTRRLGIAGKGKEVANAEGMLVPGKIGGLNQEEEWEMDRVRRKQIREAQGYDDRMDESLGMSHRESGMKQSYKDRRDESKGMEKSRGRRAYQRVGTMDRRDSESPLADESVFGPYVNDNIVGQDYAGQVIGQDSEDGLPVQNVEDGIAEEIFGDVGEGNDFGQMRAEDVYDAELTMWQRAVQKHGIPPAKRSKARAHPAHKAYRGRKQRDGVMYHHGDKVSKYNRSKGYSTKGINTGRGWYMERGYGTARKPVPSTPLTRKLGIAGAGRQTRTPLGLFGRIKRMLVPPQGRVGYGYNERQPWEMRGARAGRAIREAEDGCPNCGFRM